MSASSKITACISNSPDNLRPNIWLWASANSRVRSRINGKFGTKRWLALGLDREQALARSQLFGRSNIALPLWISNTRLPGTIKPKKKPLPMDSKINDSLINIYVLTLFILYINKNDRTLFLFVRSRKLKKKLIFVIMISPIWYRLLSRLFTRK